jgi:hypothetical protein
MRHFAPGHFLDTSAPIFLTLCPIFLTLCGIFLTGMRLAYPLGTWPAPARGVP